VTVDLIVNRTARHLGETSKLRRVLIDAAARHGVTVHETRSLEELDGVTRALARSDPSAVVLAGGDGSYMEGLSALARAFEGRVPLVALAPGGTFATVARNLGLHDAPRAWAERIVAAACAPAPRTRATATLSVRDDAGGRRIAFIAGAGLVARFFDRYDAGPHQGLVPAAAIAAQVALGSLVGAPLARRVLAPVVCAIEVDGVVQSPQAWSLVLASVVRDVGLGVRATYRAGPSVDGFHVIASTLSPRGLAAQVPRVLTGRPMRGAGHVDAIARSLRVTFGEPDAYVLDGDLMRAREVHVDAGPAVRIVIA
jgi:diacylglycerol kinase (ATP)